MLSILQKEGRNMTKEELKQRVLERIDARRDEIIAIGEQIFHNPELGFKEYKTARLVRDTFDSLGLAHEDGIALTLSLIHI